MKQLPVVALVGLVLSLGAVAGSAGAADEGTAPSEHVVMNPDQLQWGPPPPVFAAGSQMAVVQGDPFSEGDFVVRMKMPAGYKIMPHWHPTTENVTVLSGTLHIGMGDTFDDQAGTALAPGGYVSLPAEMRHYAWSDGPCEIQIHAKGPFVLTYVNPADDPSGVQH